ncbi:MAG: hypothetical protein E6K82_10925 [Candidatus Rokuibacteriota bacterium]|nr:MAG: hypothetical protein E6K82_10925 [Candidatus Rokubacteria bacterium]
MTRLRCWARRCTRLEAPTFPLVVLSLIGSIVFGTPIVAVPEARAGAPTDAMGDFFAAVNVVLNDPATEEQPQERLRAIRRRVDDVFDFREAAMLALGREWAARTPAEQNEFVALFADLLERSFVWRVAGKASLAGGVRVDYLSETVNGEAATVETEVATRAGNALRLDYRMVYRGERWVVRDVVMDGVSTMDNYRAQFQRLARDGSWPELMAQLRAKLAVPGATTQVAATPPPMMWPSELRAPDRVTEPMVPVPVPALRVAQAPAAVADERPAAAAPAEIAVPVKASAPTVAPAPATVPAPTVPTPTVTAPTIAAPRLSAAAVEAPTLAAPMLAAPGVETPAVTVSAPAPVVVARATSTVTTGPAVAPRESPVRELTAKINGEILVVAFPSRPEPPLLRVRVGPFPDRARALERLHQLQAEGWRASFIVQ